LNGHTTFAYPGREDANRHTVLGRLFQGPRARPRSDIDAEDDDGFEGRIDWGYDGWLAYVKFDFGR